MEPPDIPVPDKPWQDFMEEFVFESIPRGESVVEKFLASHKNLSRTDRNILRSWVRIIRGFFRVRAGVEGPRAFCLVNEVTYPLVSEDFFPEGSYFVGRLFPVGDGYSLPGTSSTILPDDSQRIEALLATALQIQAIAPGMAFLGNPEKMDRSRDLATRRRAFFIETFGADEKVGPGDELAGEFERFRREWTEKEPAPALYPDTDNAVPDEIRKAGDAGMVMDEAYGLGLMKNYGRFLEICRAGSTDDEDAKAVMAMYIANIEGAPPAWSRALERFPETTQKAVATLVGEEAALEFLTAGRALLESPRPFPPVVAILDDDLAKAVEEKRKNLYEGGGPE